MSGTTTVTGRLRRTTLRTRLTACYAALLAVVVVVVLVAAAFLFRTATAPPGVETSTANARSVELAAVLAIVLAVLAGWWLAWRFAGLYLRPLRELNAQARDISATDLRRRLGLDGPDEELTQLGGTLDDLFGRLEASFESQRRFVANASHELRTPLAGQRTLLQVALGDPDATAAELRAACEEVLALGERQERLVDGLLTLATGERGIEHREPADLAEIVERVLRARDGEAARRGIELCASLDPAPVAGDPVLLESMAANLVDNALQYNAAGGRVEVATGTGRAVARLSVGNTGPIVPAAEVDGLFEPFRRLGRTRTGSGDRHGLGLAIVTAIARSHGAAVAAGARAAGGLDIAVDFPGRGGVADWVVDGAARWRLAAGDGVRQVRGRGR